MFQELPARTFYEAVTGATRQKGGRIFLATKLLFWLHVLHWFQHVNALTERQESVDIPAGRSWTACNYYGLKYTTACTTKLPTAYISTLSTCGTKTTQTCAAYAPYGALTCTNQLNCEVESFAANSVNLCLVLLNNQNSAPVHCNVYINGETSPITSSSSSSWPLWQKITVAAGAVIGLIILGLLITLASYMCCCRKPRTVAPAAPAAADAIGPDPYDLAATPAKPALEYKPPPEGLVQPDGAYKPARYAPYQPRKAETAYSPQPLRSPMQLPHTILYPEQYTQPQRVG